MNRQPLLAGGKAVIVGLGLTGLSVARYLAANGVDFTMVDTRKQPPALEEFCHEFSGMVVHTGELDEAVLEAADEIVLSPGMPRSHPVIQRVLQQGVSVIGDVELFARAVHAPVIAVTGSNGKSTVVTLLGEMARSAGIAVRTGGNLGPPALDLLADNAAELYVLELSSFQLESLDALAPCAATVLNISADHLDHHGDMAAYIAAKHRVFRGATSWVLNLDDSLVCGMTGAGARIGFGMGIPREGDFGLIEAAGESWLAWGSRRLMRVGDMALAGAHNAANALAALALGNAVGIPRTAMCEALRRFGGLPHRCQRVAEFDGVAWYNDSKATNVASTVAAIYGLSDSGEKLLLIAGGKGKGADFSALTEAVSERVRAVVLIGEDAGVIANTLGDAVPLVRATSMAAAVAVCRRLAHRGDRVLLAPACASFDMFADYRARGEAFIAAVIAEQTP